MRTAKGIKGIRIFLRQIGLRKGWHVWVDDEYLSYHNMTAFEIYETLRMKYTDLTFTGWTGNGINFTNQ